MHNNDGKVILSVNIHSSFSKDAESFLGLIKLARPCGIGAICIICIISLLIALPFINTHPKKDKETWWTLGCIFLAGNVVGLSCMAAATAYAKRADTKLIAILRRTDSLPVSEAPRYNNLIPWYVFAAIAGFYAITMIVTPFAYYCVRKMRSKRFMTPVPTQDKEIHITSSDCTEADREEEKDDEP
ncbi:MAG: hypothetical protein ABW189_04660 [Rickettsiales bacterium]